MQTTTGDPGALVASNLAQAEATLQAAVLMANPKAASGRGIDLRKTVQASYEYWLELVTTGQAPKR